MKQGYYKLVVLTVSILVYLCHVYTHTGVQAHVYSLSTVFTLELDLLK